MQNGEDGYVLHYRTTSTGLNLASTECQSESESDVLKKRPRNSYWTWASVLTSRRAAGPVYTDRHCSKWTGDPPSGACSPPFTASKPHHARNACSYVATLL